jgi:hypothetical protein
LQLRITGYKTLHYGSFFWTVDMIGEQLIDETPKHHIAYQVDVETR